MNLVHGKYNIVLSFEENMGNCLVVENAHVFTELVQEINSQVSGSEGNFVLSDNEKELKISKVVECILEPIALNANSRKNISQLYSELEKYCNDVKYTEFNQIVKDLIELMDYVSVGSCYDLDYGFDLSPEAFFKMLNVKFTEEITGLKEKIIQYINIVSALGTTKLLVFINLKVYLDEEDIREIYEISFYRKLHILLIERTDYGRIKDETACVLDSDLCIIDMK